MNGVLAVMWTHVRPLATDPCSARRSPTVDVAPTMTRDDGGHKAGRPQGSITDQSCTHQSNRDEICSNVVYGVFEAAVYIGSTLIQRRELKRR